MTSRYHGANAKDNIAVFRDGQQLYATNTQGLPVGTTLMQDDGNLAAYDRSGHPRWASGTAGHPGAYLSLRNDGVT